MIVSTRERIRFFRFAIVGSVGAVVDFGVLNLLAIVFDVPTVWASVVSFIAAVGSNFTWNRLWTYPDSRSKPIVQQGVQFLLVSLIGLIIRTPLFALIEHNLLRLLSGAMPVRWISAQVVAHNIALAVVIGVVMIWNFIANRYWTYNDIT